MDAELTAAMWKAFGDAYNGGKDPMAAVLKVVRDAESIRLGELAEAAVPVEGAVKP